MLKKKKYLLALCMFTLFLCTGFSFQIEQDISGKWFSTDLDNSTMVIAKNAEGYYEGKIIASEKEENIGKVVLSEAHFSKEEQLWKALMSPPSRSIHINATIYPSENQLKIVGKLIFITKTVYWKRVE